MDMSEEQLQNLTSQSFGSTEQIASHGALQKFVFIRRRGGKCKDSPGEVDLHNNRLSVNWQFSQASMQPPTKTTAPAAPAAATPPPSSQP